MYFWMFPQLGLRSFSLVSFPSALVLDFTMAATPAANASMECKLCGLHYEAAAGRQRGASFECSGCSSACAAMRRNLGALPDELQEYSKEEFHSFFRSLKAERDKHHGANIKWECLKATLLDQLTTRTVQRFENSVQRIARPLSVWLKKGYLEEVVKRQEKEDDPDLGEVYRLPVSTLKWTDCHETIKEKMMQKEMAATKGRKNKRKAEEDDLDLPENKEGDAKVSGEKGQKAAARKEEQENKRRCRRNDAMNAEASRCLAVMTPLPPNIAKLITALHGLPEAADIIKMLQGQLDQCNAWCAACRAFMAAYAAHTQLMSPEPLSPLEIAMAEVKTLQKQFQETSKAARAAVTAAKAAKAAKAPKARAKAKAKAEPESNKRQRATGKQPGRDAVDQPEKRD